MRLHLRAYCTRIQHARALAGLPYRERQDSEQEKNSGTISPEMPEIERVDPLVRMAAGENAAALAMHAASST